MPKTRGAKGRFATSPIKRGSYVDYLTPGIALYADHLHKTVEKIMREWGKESVAWMQANAPWVDNTGDARSGLDFAVVESRTEPRVYLMHTVSYGIWLEIRWNGRYAIIMPAIEARGDELMRMLRVI